MDVSAHTQKLRIVLLPGMDGTGELFSEFAAALAEEFEVVTVRYPTEQCLSYPELEDFVRAACLPSGPFVLLAESFSTPLAIRYAASNPANLEGVILCAGFVASPVRGWRRLFVRVLSPLIFRIPLPHCAAKLWLVGADAPPKLLTTVRAAVASVQPKVLTSRLNMVLGCDVRAELGRITAPVLTIQAKQDRLVDAACLEKLRQIKPQMAVAKLDGPHLLLQREPHRAAETVAGFVRSGFLGTAVSRRRAGS